MPKQGHLAHVKFRFISELTKNWLNCHWDCQDWMLALFFFTLVRVNIIKRTRSKVTLTSFFFTVNYSIKFIYQKICKKREIFKKFISVKINYQITWTVWLVALSCVDNLTRLIRGYNHLIASTFTFVCGTDVIQPKINVCRSCLNSVQNFLQTAVICNSFWALL